MIEPKRGIATPAGSDEKAPQGNSAWRYEDERRRINDERRVEGDVRRQKREALLQYEARRHEQQFRRIEEQRRIEAEARQRHREAQRYRELPKTR